MMLSLFLIIFVGPCWCFMTNQLLQYRFINEVKTWDEAQKYCREKHTDLATVTSMADMKRLNQDLGSRKAWIGLYRDAGGSRMWQWSQPEVQFNESQSKWDNYEPGDSGTENCGAVRRTLMWLDLSCNSIQPFICYDERNSSEVIYATVKRNWTDAQSFCRNNHTDLISGPEQMKQLEKTQQSLLNLVGDDYLFIGLFRDAWQWSDGSRSSFRFWNLTYDDEVDDKRCVMLNEEGRWNSEKCCKTHHFVCHEGKKSLKATVQRRSRLSCCPHVGRLVVYFLGQGARAPHRTASHQPRRNPRRRSSGYIRAMSRGPGSRRPSQ
ncbi:C-type mannose receptor 2-like, partial [Oryzias melastigma]|uniref:C-type mannose receptor 2-like n=1 Tax=Oryzias melastigma TaxID=30732 RepID=UPI00168CDB8A